MRATKGSEAGVIASGWPRATVISLIGLISALLSAFILSLISSTISPSSALIMGISAIWAPSIAFAVLQSVVIGGGIMNVRRSITNTSILLTLILLTSLLSLALNKLGLDISINEAVLIGASLAASFNALIYRYMTGKSLAISGGLSVIWPLLIMACLNYTIHAGLMDISPAKILTILIIMALPAMAMSRGIDKLGEKLVGISAKRVFRAYVTNLLTGAREDLEYVFNHVSVKSKVKCNILRILDNTNKLRGLIAIPYVHPGPLKNIGSSSLPSDLMSTLESRYNVKTLVFHSFTTHASDITSTHDYQSFLNQVLQSIATQGEMLTGPSSPLIRVKEHGLSIGCQVIKGMPILFVSGEDIGVEDLPEDLRLKIENEAKELYGLKPLLINAHNSYEENPMMNVESLKASALKAMGLALSRLVQEPLRMGISRISVNRYGKSHGLGDGGIGALVIELGGLKYCYLVIDANNADREFRLKVKEKIMSMGFNDCELFTTDNHTIVNVRGVKAKRGYYILGEKIKADDISDLIEKAVREAKQNMCEAKIVHNTIEAEAHVLGDIGHRNIESLMEQAVKTFRSLGLMSVSYTHLTLPTN